MHRKRISSSQFSKERPDAVTSVQEFTYAIFFVRFQIRCNMCSLSSRTWSSRTTFLQRHHSLCKLSTRFFFFLRLCRLDICICGDCHHCILSNIDSCERRIYLYYFLTRFFYALIHLCPSACSVPGS